MGSGTTALAAIKEERQFIGIELEKQYVALATKQIDKALKNANRPK
jgi:DNA modification methylase